MKTYRAMKAKDSKLCLDCEHIHTSRQCPICASESYIPAMKLFNPNQRTAYPFHDIDLSIYPPEKLRNDYSRVTA